MSFEIIDQSAHTVGLQQAILLYGSRPHAVEYATLHSVVIGDDNAPVIGAGKPMTRNTLRTIERNLAKSTRRKGVLPANILSVGVDHMIWYVAADLKPAVFSRCEIGFSCLLICHILN